MIDWLKIRHFVITDQADIEFDSGFTTITGETGSGKSIIVDALGLLLGGRADDSFIQHGHSTAELQAGFDLPPGHQALVWLKKHDLDSDRHCLIRRVLRKGRSSRVYINDRSTTVSQVRDLGKELIDIHGQNEHHSLLRNTVQQSLLDLVAENTSSVHTLGQVVDRLHGVQNKIDDLNALSQSNQQQAEFLRFQIQELAAIDPSEQEWVELETAHKRAQHLQELITGSRSIGLRLYEADNENISDALVQCSQQLTQLSQFDNTLSPLASMLDEAQVNVEEAARQLRTFYQGMEIDEQELKRIEERFAIYHHLGRKHHVPPHQLGEHLQNMKQELSRLNDPATEMDRLERLKTREIAHYQSIATQISKNRHQTARHLSLEVTQMMQQLGMEGGVFEITFQPTSPDTLARQGLESVEFTVTTNPGQPPGPLNKIASGGELSRISLAIQVILATRAWIPTLVFDEVDVGIGGSIAAIIGSKLRALGQSKQVISVTHLPQVAAKGEHHFRVSKEVRQSTNTRIAKLNHTERVDEIARMTSGEKLTPQSLAHAEAMLRSA